MKAESWQSSLGGFLLACDAANEAAVAELRSASSDPPSIRLMVRIRSG